MVEINHGNGLATRYGHNEKLLVKEGDMVRKGQEVSLMARPAIRPAPICILSAQERRAGGSVTLHRRRPVGRQGPPGRGAAPRSRPRQKTISRPYGLSVQ